MVLSVKNREASIIGAAAVVWSALPQYMDW
jgi:hypothetical protein